jgi:hypothetical protein
LGRSSRPWRTWRRREAQLEGVAVGVGAHHGVDRGWGRFGAVQITGCRFYAVLNGAELR